MFGTLSIMLSSMYQGGELVVNHEGESATFDLAQHNAFSTHYIAFYAGRQWHVAC